VIVIWSDLLCIWDKTVCNEACVDDLWLSTLLQIFLLQMKTMSFVMKVPKGTHQGQRSGQDPDVKDCSQKSKTNDCLKVTYIVMPVTADWLAWCCG